LRIADALNYRVQSGGRRGLSSNQAKTVCSDLARQMSGPGLLSRRALMNVVQFAFPPEHEVGIQDILADAEGIEADERPGGEERQHGLQAFVVGLGQELFVEF
jgi:hypothetical protein